MDKETSRDLETREIDEGLDGGFSPDCLLLSIDGFQVAIAEGQMDGRERVKQDQAALLEVFHSRYSGYTRPLVG